MNVKDLRIELMMSYLPVNIESCLCSSATVLERAVKQVGTPKDSIQLRDRM